MAAGVSDVNARASLRRIETGTAKERKNDIRHSGAAAAAVSWAVTPGRTVFDDGGHGSVNAAHATETSEGLLSFGNATSSGYGTSHGFVTDGDDGHGRLATVTGCASPNSEVPPFRPSSTGLAVAVCMCMIPMFMGYSALTKLQKKIKQRMHIEDNGSHESYLFGVAVSFYYAATLLFRIGHNVSFSTLRPRTRALGAYAAMLVTNLLLLLDYYVWDVSSLVPVFVAYSLGGAAVATFEPNFMSCLTPLGPEVKSWAAVGFPLGVGFIGVGAFTLFSLMPGNPDGERIVFGVWLLCTGVGFFLFWKVVPVVPFEATRDTVQVFWHHLRSWRQWLTLRIATHAACYFVDQMSVSLIVALVLYTYDSPMIRLWPPTIPFDFTTPPAARADGPCYCVDRNVILATNYGVGFLFGALSRRLAFVWFQRRHAAVYLIFNVLAVLCIVSKVGLLGPVGLGLVMWGNGCVYSTTLRFIDKEVPWRVNLVVLSVVMFCGDAGALAGANLVVPIRAAIGHVL